jgi:DNA topoisomerase VI subunit B
MDKGLVFNNDILNVEYIENDIRLSEAIREAIKDIKLSLRPNTNKSSELDKRKFLQKYYETSELIGVSLTVEHILPCLIELFK